MSTSSSSENHDSDGQIVSGSYSLVLTNGNTEANQVSEVNTVRAEAAAQGMLYEIGNDTNGVTEIEVNNPVIHFQDSSLLQLVRQLRDMHVTLGNSKDKSLSVIQNPFKLNVSDTACVEQHLNCSIFSVADHRLPQLLSQEQGLQIAGSNISQKQIFGTDESVDLLENKFYSNVKHFNVVFSKWSHQQSQTLNKTLASFKYHCPSKQLPSMRLGKASWHNSNNGVSKICSFKQTQIKKNILSKSKLNFIVTHVADMSSSIGSAMQDFPSIDSALQDPVLSSYGLHKGYEPHPKKVRQIMMESHQLNFLLHNAHLTLSATFASHFKNVYFEGLTHGSHMPHRDVTCFSLNTLSAALPSVEDHDSASNLESAASSSSGQLCTLQVRSRDDVTINELASYFDNMVHIPKKMSVMAEMMYT